MIKDKPYQQNALSDQQELFQRIAAGDKDAYTSVFAAYYDHVYLKALVICKIPAMAKDIAQQVFLTLWEKRAGLGEVGNPEHWLMVLARNQVLNTFKRRSRDEQYIEYLREYFEEAQSSPEDAMIIEQRKVLMEKSLEVLTGKQREVYLLRREHGLTHQQIADHLGVSKDTIKEHLEKATARIRKYLAAHRGELLLLGLVLKKIVIS